MDPLDSLGLSIKVGGGPYPGSGGSGGTNPLGYPVGPGIGGGGIGPGGYTLPIGGVPPYVLVGPPTPVVGGGGVIFVSTTNNPSSGGTVPVAPPKPGDPGWTPTPPIDPKNKLLRSGTSPGYIY